MGRVARFNLRVFLLPIAAALPLAAACGGDDDANGSEPTTAPQTNAPGDDADDAEVPTEAPASDSGGGDDRHACDLVTPEEVSAAVGVEMNEGRDYLAAAAGATNCEWQSVDGATTVYAEILPEGGQSYFDAVHFGDDPAFEEQPVEGLGDEAIYSDLGVLDVVDDDTYLAVQVIVFGSDIDELTAGTALAEVILEKLG